MKQTLVFPIGVDTFRFPKDCNEKLEPGFIPDHITSIDTGLTYNQEFDVGVLPKGLKKLVIWNGYKQMLKLNALPESLEILILRDYSMEIGIRVLPKSLKVLKIINITKTNFSPKIIKFGVLPESLETLKLNCYYHKIRTNVLPKTLKTLSILGYKYKINVGILPDSLETLILDSYPNTIKRNALPKTLKTLVLHECHSVMDQTALLKTITNLFVYFTNIESLDENLTYNLYIHGNQNIEYFYDILTKNNIYEKFEVSNLKKTIIDDVEINYVVATPKNTIITIEDRLTILENKTNKIMEFLKTLVEDVQ